LSPTSLIFSAALAFGGLVDLPEISSVYRSLMNGLTTQIVSSRVSTLHQP